jgi:hypothetical protein
MSARTFASISPVEVVQPNAVSQSSQSTLNHPLTLTGMLYHNNHANPIRLIGIVNVIDHVLSMSTGCLYDLGSGRGEIEES